MAPLFGAGGPLAPLTTLTFSARDARTRSQLKQEQQDHEPQQPQQEQQEQETHEEHAPEAAGDDRAAPRLLLDAADARLHASFRLEYIDLLQRWQLFPQMVEVLNCHRTTSGAMDTADDAAAGASSVRARCGRCGGACAGAYCAACRAHTARCALCELPVRGLAWACPRCRHGGHLDHMVRWFAHSTACPAGCGCLCPPPPAPQ